MSVSFATPLAATFVVLVGLVPLGVLLSERRRLHRVCGQLGLRPPQDRNATSFVIALTLLVTLLALAAAQPVVATQTTERGRADAEAFFVLDTSRSMAAGDGAGSSTRLDRARADAKELRARLPGLAVGVASLTDRVLPHLFPTMSTNDFNATLDESLAIDRPTSSVAYGDAVGTKLGALGDLVAANYFSPAAKRRVAVVFTDGETLPENLSALPMLFAEGNVNVFFVQYWERDERIYDADGALNPAYAPEPALTTPLATLAKVMSSRVYEPRQTGDVAAAIGAAIGDGPMTTRGRELGTRLLTPYLVLVSFLPLAFLLGHDEWTTRRRRRGTRVSGATTTRATAATHS
jgi:VWA domain-containing protein